MKAIVLPRRRQIVVPYPNIYQSQWETVYPLRCPACGSDEYYGMHFFVDEEFTFAINPMKFSTTIPKILKYQRYIVLTCGKCEYSYHRRPEGLWYEKKHPSMGISTYLIENPDELPLEPVESYSDIEEDALFFVGTYNIDDKKDKKLQKLSKDYPIYLLPSPHFIMSLNKGQAGLTISRSQDFRIIELARKKRYSDYELNPTIVRSPIMLLTGAGFSAALKIPTMRDFKDKIPEWIKITLESWLKHKENWMVRIWEDFEILIDVLLRIQRIGIMAKDESDFLNLLRNEEDTSIFIFNEQSSIIDTDESIWSCYPSLSHLKVHKEYSENQKSEHFQKIRKVLYCVIKTMILLCHVVNDNNIKSDISPYFSFLNQLLEINVGPLPIYTTNFDRVIETAFEANKEKEKVVNGVEKAAISAPEILIKKSEGIYMKFPIRFPAREIKNLTYSKIADKKIALFHLHGASNWFINTDSRLAIELETDRKELSKIFDCFWHGSDPWIAGSIVPATVKDGYTISHPFNIGYDYMAENIKYARILIIIGQRMRDETLKEMVYWSSKSNPELNYVVVDLPELKESDLTNESSLCHVLDCISKDRLKYFGSGFPKRADDVLQYCKEVLKASATMPIFLDNHTWSIFAQLEQANIEWGKYKEFLNSKEAQMLFSKYRDNDKNEIDILLESTGFHKDILKVLFVALESNIPGRNTKQIIDYLNLAQLNEAFQDDFEYKTHDENERKVLILSRRLFKLMDFREYEKWILKQFAVLPSIDIDGNELLEILKIENNRIGSFANSLYLLTKTGWLEHKGLNCFRTNPTLQNILRHILKPHYADCKILIQSLTNKLHENHIIESLDSRHKWIKYSECILKFITEINSETILLKNNLCSAFRFISDYEKAQNLGEISLKETIAYSGKNNPMVALISANIGLASWKLKNYTKALKMLKKALKINLKNYGESHKEVAVCYSDLALVYKDSGRYKKAKRYFEKALVLYPKFFGCQHPDTTDIESNFRAPDIGRKNQL